MDNSNYNCQYLNIQIFRVLLSKDIWIKHCVENNAKLLYHTQNHCKMICNAFV